MSTNFQDESVPCKRPFPMYWYYLLSVIGLLVVSIILAAGVGGILSSETDISQDEYAGNAAGFVFGLVFCGGIIGILWPRRKHFIDGWNNALDFEGRATRPQFWVFILMNGAICACATIIVPFLSIFCSLVVFVPELSMTVRRLTDAGAPKFWVVIPSSLIILSIAEEFQNPEAYFWSVCSLIGCLIAYLIIGLAPSAAEVAAQTEEREKQ